MLDAIWRQTITEAGTFWTALAAFVTFLAVLVAIFLPRWTLHSEKRARQERAKAILPALLEEADRIAKQAEAAAALVIAQMSGMLSPCDQNGKRLPIDKNLPNQKQDFRRVLDESKRKQLQSLALVTVPIIEAFSQLLVDLPHSTSTALIRSYGHMVLARQSILSIASNWEDLEGIPLEKLREYQMHADSMVAACFQMKQVAGPRPRKRFWTRWRTAKQQGKAGIGIAGKPQSAND